MSKIVKNTFIYTLGNILPQAVSFILLPVYTKYLIPSEYGIVNAMTVVQALIAVFFSLSIERSLIRMYWDYREQEKLFLGTLSITIAILSFVVLILILLLRDYITLLFQGIDFYPFYLYTILMTFSLTFSLVPKNYYRLKNEATKYFYVSLIELIVNTSLIIYFLMVKEESALGVIKAKMFASLFLLPLFISITLRNISFGFNYQILKSCLLFSLPTIPTVFAAWFLTQADRVFIAGYLSLHELGIYSLSTRIASLVSVLTSAFTMAYHPVFFELAVKNEPSSREKLRKMNNAFIITLLFVCFLLAFFSREVIYIFLNYRYQSAFIYVPAIICTYLVGSISSSILGAFFQQSKKMSADMFFGILGAVITFLFNYYLVNKIGLWGSILGNFLATATIFALLYRYAKSNCYFLPFSWKKIIVISGVLIFLILLFNYILVPDLLLSLFLKMLILVFLSGYFLVTYSEELSFLKMPKLLVSAIRVLKR